MAETPVRKFARKGQVFTGVSAIILLAVGVGIATVITVFMGVLAGQTFSLTQNQIDELFASVVNESFTGSNSTATRLDFGSIVDGSLVITNSTGGAVGLGNFTVNYPLGTVLVNGGTYNNVALLASYDHGSEAIRDSVQGSIEFAFQAQEQSAQYSPLLILAVAIGVILTVVLSIPLVSSLLGGGGGGMGGAL